MKNLEIKARCKDHIAAVKALKNLNAEYKGVLRQRDVYFRVDSGRLKLRSINGSEHQLIYYRRSDKREARYSSYFIEQIRYPKVTEKLLRESLGVLVTVNKRRVLYLYENVRIHLDNVNGLGRFLEIEIVCSTKKETIATTTKMKMLKKEIGIKAKDLIGDSYSDMLLSRKFNTKK